MLAGKWKNRESISVRLILAIVGFSTFIAIFATAVQLFLDYRRDVDRVHGDLAYVEADADHRVRPGNGRRRTLIDPSPGGVSASPQDTAQ